jgi:uncharacterized SAM-binding protein YcdF (DUF218 family)
MPIVRLRFHAGVLAGILLVLATIVLINKTPMADWLVAPLIVPDANETTDAIVVLGAGVLDNCIVNNNGMRRVLLGVRLWRERRAPVLLFTGGAQDSCPVATAMALLARELGVPDEQVRVESRSRTTRENAESCALVLRGLGLRRVTLVTDQLHMLRAAGLHRCLSTRVMATTYRCLAPGCASTSRSRTTGCGGGWTRRPLWRRRARHDGRYQAIPDVLRGSRSSSPAPRRRGPGSPPEGRDTHEEIPACGRAGRLHAAAGARQAGGRRRVPPAVLPGARSFPLARAIQALLR